jgi:hypothetical protein
MVASDFFYPKVPARRPPHNPDVAVLEKDKRKVSPLCGSRSSWVLARHFVIGP